MDRRRHLLSLGLALLGHGLLMLLFWQQAAQFVPAPADVDNSPRLAFEVVETSSPEPPGPVVEPPAPDPAIQQPPPPESPPLARLPPPSADSGPQVVPPAPDGAPSKEAAPTEEPVQSPPGAAPRVAQGAEAPGLTGPALGPQLPDTWMGRVLLGSGPRLADEETDRHLAPGRLPSDDERAERVAQQWATVDERPGEVTANKRVLREGVAGGYRYVDEKTGEPLAEPPEPAANKVPMFAEGGRRLSEGFTDEWHRRPPKKAPRDDLVPTADGGFVYSASGYTAKIEPNGAVRFSENLMSVKFGETSDVSDGLLPFQGRDFTSGRFDATDALMRLAGKDPYVTDN